MTECTRAAVDVDALGRDAHILHRGHRHAGKSLVDLVEIGIVRLPVELLEHPRDRPARRGREPFGLLRLARLREQARERLDTASLRGRLAHQDHRRGTVRDR